MVVGLLLARTAPFDSKTQSALRAQQGWGTWPPTDIPTVRTHGRYEATATLRCLTATEPPASLLEALRVLERSAPCTGGDAAAILLDSGAITVSLHPGGVLSLARWYGVPHGLRLQRRPDGTTVTVGPPSADLTAAVRRVTASLGRAGHVNLGGICGDNSRLRRRLELDLSQRPGIRVQGDLALSVNDQSSGLAMHVVRMLRASPRPLGLTEVHEGLLRGRRFRRDRLLPFDLLEAWVVLQPWIVRDGAGLTTPRRLSSRLSSLAASGGTAQLLPLVRPGRVVSWQQLLGALQAAGMAAEAAKTAVHCSPILVHVGLDAYQLRGGAGQQ